MKTLADGIYTVTTRDGPERKIAKEQVLSIDSAPFPVAQPAKPSGEVKNLLMETVKPSTPFGSPRQTFEIWRAAAVKGDIDLMVKCYASSKQKEKAKELKKIPKETFQKMTEATVETLFSPAEPVYQGDRAMLEVNWTHGLLGDSQVLQFILEKNEWKLSQ